MSRQMLDAFLLEIFLLPPPLHLGEGELADWDEKGRRGGEGGGGPEEGRKKSLKEKGGGGENNYKRLKRGGERLAIFSPLPTFFFISPFLRLEN